MRNLVFCFLIFSLTAVADTPLRIISDRTESHVTPLLDLFEKKTGIKTKVLTVKSGLLGRLIQRPEECDVVFTKTAVILEEAKKQGALQAFQSDVLLQNIPIEFRDEENYYYVPSYRARAIYYSKERVDPKELKGYESLTDSKWKGRVAIRSGFHSYNLSLFCQLTEARGWEWTKSWIDGLKSNLAAAPQSNDRGQVRMVFENKADLAVANSYYMGIMLATPEQRPWGEATGIYFPDQDGQGAHVIRSGVAMTKSKRHPEKATKFLEFLASELAQRYFGQALNAYSIDDSLPLSEVNQNLGLEQVEVVKGRYKRNIVSLSKGEQHRDKVVQYLEKIKFDQ